jgi:hypothetical protein
VDPVLVLTEPVAQVDPGGEARVPVTVRNVGDLVEQYQFEVLGESARWATVQPRQVSVLPHGQEEKTVEVVFRPPPAPAAPAGEIPFGVRCVSLERRDRCAVVEGDVAVGAVHDLTAALEPVDPSGRWTGRYRVRFDNAGSVPVTLALDAADKKQLLRFALAPKELTVPPGQSAPAYVAVRPRQPMMRGKAVEHQFTVAYRTAGGDTLTNLRGESRGGELPGTFGQKPVIGGAVLAVGLVGVLLAAGGGVLALRARNNGPAGPKATAGAPPATEMVGAARLTDTSVQMIWQGSPYAKGYVIQQVTPDGTVSATKEITEPDQTTYTWTDLKPGRTCFRVLIEGTSGVRSAPSTPKCATLAAAPVTTAPTTPPPSSAPPTSAPPTSAAGGTTPPPSGGPSGGPVGGPGGGGNGGGKIVLTGFYVIYKAFGQDDPAAQGQAEQLVSKLQGAGSQAQLVDSLKSDQLSDGADSKGLWVVVQDGFSSYDTALAECNARRNIAADCYVVRPTG